LFLVAKRRCQWQEFSIGTYL